MVVVFFFFKQKTAYEMRISDWSSDVCSSDLTRKRTAMEPKATQAPVMDPWSLPARAGSSYPEQFRAAVAARQKRALGDAFGLTAFGQIGRASGRERVCKYG